MDPCVDDGGVGERDKIDFQRRKIITINKERYPYIYISIVLFKHVFGIVKGDEKCLPNFGEKNMARACSEDHFSLLLKGADLSRIEDLLIRFDS